MFELLVIAGTLYLVSAFITRKPEPRRASEIGPRKGLFLFIAEAETENMAKALIRALPSLVETHGLPRRNLIAAVELNHRSALSRLALAGRYKYLLRKSYQLGFCRGPDITAYLHDRQELKKHQSLYVIWYEGLESPFVFIANSSKRPDAQANLDRGEAGESVSPEPS
jgi:hypothetical protein